MFNVAPLKFHDATGSPVNPLAIFYQGVCWPDGAGTQSPTDTYLLTKSPAAGTASI